MKRIFVSMTICLLAIAGMQAQTIQNGSKWWDGAVLYTAQLNQSGHVTMLGKGEFSDAFRFELDKVADKPGEYVLAGTDVQAASLRAQVGWRVQYVRQDGMNFLAVRKPNGDAVWKITLTPDDLNDCLAQRKTLDQHEVSWLLQHYLLNPYYLGRFSKDELRLMRNEILARHGWRFQSKDLQDHFGRQSWYKPGNDNSAIKLHVIEQLNIQLIKSEEAVPDNMRGYMDMSDSVYNKDLRELVDGKGQFPGGLDDDGRGPEETDAPEVTVFTEDQFIGSLRSGRTVKIGDDVHLNLSRVLENEAFFRGKTGRRWASYGTLGKGTEPTVISEESGDGHQLTLKNFYNLTISGGKNASIEVDPRYAFCLNFVDCEGIVVSNLTIGHTEGGYCDGGVIGVSGGRRVNVLNCDLYGCGTYGVVLNQTHEFSLYESNIHDCTYGIMQLHDSEAVKFLKCDFFNNREFGLVTIYDCENVMFDDCRFFANWGDAQLFTANCSFGLVRSAVYHPTENLGRIDLAVRQNTTLNANPLDPDIKPRDIGPK